MIRANKSPNLRKVSRVARRMQPVSRGTSVDLWNLSLKVPRGTVSHAHDRVSRVPRGTGTSPRKRCRHVPRETSVRAIGAFAGTRSICGCDVLRGSLHPSHSYRRTYQPRAFNQLAKCIAWPVHHQIVWAAQDVLRGTKLRAIHS
jgi:hypothetical protein